MTRTMRIAYFSPLAPMRTGLSDYSEDLLPHLCRRVHVDAYTEDRVAATQEVGRVYPLYGYRDFSAQRDRYDHLVFQLADSPEHGPVYDLFLRFGGVVALHDLDLSGLLGQGDGWSFLWEVKRHEGLGPFLRTAGDALLHRHWPPPGRLEMDRLVAQRATGLIVHSAEAREHLQARYPGVRLREIPIGIPRPPVIDPQEARQSLNLPPEDFVCVSVGRLDPEKRIHVAMQAFARLLERYPNSTYVLVGEPAPGYPLQELAETLGIAGRVRLTGYVDLATLYRYLAACDVGISLRQPRRGEAPAGLLRIMSLGRPVVATSAVPDAQLPHDCALKVDAGAGETAQVVAALWALAAHPAMRLCYGRRAAQLVQSRHAPAAAARQYVEFLEALATFQAAEEILLRQKTV